MTFNMPETNGSSRLSSSGFMNHFLQVVLEERKWTADALRKRQQQIRATRPGLGVIGGDDSVALKHGHPHIRSTGRTEAAQDDDLVEGKRAAEIRAQRLSNPC